MATDVRVPVAAESLPRVPLAPARGSLTKRAVLTAVASLVDYGAQLAVSLVLTPILVRGLGASLFGIWEMLRQAVGYMTAADGRPMDALRLVIASRQASDDVAQQRRYVGAALLVWLLFLPIVLLVGTIIVSMTPAITKVGPELHSTIRVACALLVASFLTGTLAAIPEAVLRGMNLGYKRMGWQAGLSVAGGLLAAAAVYAGLGLVGLGAAQVALAGLTGLCFWMLARKHVPAFGIARPMRPEVRSLLSMSAWLTGGLMLSNVLLSSDVLILGMIVSPAVVTTYVLTGSAARMAVSLFNFTVGATTPGLGGLIGQREFERAAQIRAELVGLTWLFVTAAGAAILIWNRSFVSLWVGEEHYAGMWVNVLVVAIMVQTAFIRGDAFIIDAALRPRPRVIVTAVAAVLTIAATLLLTRSLGIVGLCLGTLGGRLVQTIAYPVLAASYLGRSRMLPLARIARPLVVMAALFAGAAYLGQRVQASGWLEWIGSVALSAGVVLAIAFVAGLPGDIRRAVFERGLGMGRAFRA